MFRLFFITFTLLLSVAACARTHNEKPGAFSCHVHGHVITVYLYGKSTGERNPKYLGISSPRAFMYLKDPTIPANFTPYNIRTKTLKLDIRTQQSVRYDNGKSVQAKAFPTSGKYKLLFADNLETEPDNTFSLECTVNIAPDNMH